MENKSKLLEHRKILKRRKPIFLRTDWHKISVLGYGRKKKQKWRRASGRHNKMRQKERGHQKMPSIGFRSPKSIRGTINGKFPLIISNIEELKNIQNENIIFMASNVGKKKRIKIAKLAKEKGIKINNLDIDKIILENKPEESSLSLLKKKPREEEKTSEKLK